VLQRLLAIIRKELITMLRDPRARFSLILPPMIQLFIFSSAATMEVKNIHLALVDLDRGPYAAEVLQGLRGSRSFTALPLYPSLAAARNALERERVVGVLVLQSGFSADLAAGRPSSVQLLLDGRRSNAAQIAAQYVSTIVSAAVAGGGGAPQPGAAVAARSLPDAELVVTDWFNPNLEYRWYMLPNLVGMLSLGVALMITALSVARERELGTFDQTLVSPATPVEIALGKLLPPLLVAAVQATLYLLIVTLLYGVPFRGNPLVRRCRSFHLLTGVHAATRVSRGVRGAGAIRAAVGLCDAGGEHALVAAVRDHHQSALAHAAPDAGAVPQGDFARRARARHGEAAGDRVGHDLRCGTALQPQDRVTRARTRHPPRFV